MNIESDGLRHYCETIGKFRLNAVDYKMFKRKLPKIERSLTALASSQLERKAGNPCLSARFGCFVLTLPILYIKPYFFVPPRGMLKVK